VVFFESNADVLSLWVLSWIAVVAYVAGLSGEDAVVAPKFAVLAREPRGASLAEDDVSRNYIFA
jgi:hypothetical protein